MTKALFNLLFYAKMRKPLASGKMSKAKGRNSKAKELNSFLENIRADLHHKERTLVEIGISV